MHRPGETTILIILILLIVSANGLSKGGGGAGKKSAGAERSGKSSKSHSSATSKRPAQRAERSGEGAGARDGEEAGERAGGCGVERWAVKTLSDPRASKVDLDPRPTSVGALRSLRAPDVGRSSPRFGGAELQSWRVHGDLLAAKLEEDSDVHLVISTPGGVTETMIVEFPAPHCLKGARAAARIAAARHDFFAACGKPSSSRFTPIAGLARIEGVGFFDLIHGQRGVAGNGIELHPVTGFHSSGCRRL
jgi:hypothetical protein